MIIVVLIILHFALHQDCEAVPKHLFWENSEIWGDTDLMPSEIFFVQIGSNCGTDDCAVAGEPIWKDCQRHHWSGVVVEPNPTVYQQLKTNYRNNPNVAAIKCAVSDKNGFADFFTDDGEASSLSSNHTIKHNLKTKTITVQTYRLESFWERFVSSNTSRVDILNLDCEGYDHKIILNTNFDNLHPKPKYILYESVHIPDDLKQPVLSYLKKLNYIFQKYHSLDTLVKCINN